MVGVEISTVSLSKFLCFLSGTSGRGPNDDALNDMHLQSAMWDTEVVDPKLLQTAVRNAKVVDPELLQGAVGDTEVVDVEAHF